MPTNAVETSKDDTEDGKNDEAEYAFCFRPRGIENWNICRSSGHSDCVDDVVEGGENKDNDKIDREE